MTPSIEVCVDDDAGLDAAIAGGADRIELCSRLDLGGLTPNADLFTRVASCPVPVRAMIRLRGGGFDLDDTDIARMADQINAARDAGCEGVVFGAAKGSTLDQSALSRLARAAHGLKMTLHRAVDDLPDPTSAVDVARDLGLDTILTSGGAACAAKGTKKIRQMIDRADHALTIMPGAGITPVNAAAIIAETGAHWLHGSFRDPARQTSAVLIRATRSAITAAGLAPPS